MAAAGPTGGKEMVKVIPVAALVGDQGWGVSASKRWVWGGKAPHEDLPGGGGAGDVSELGHRALQDGPGMRQNERSICEGVDNVPELRQGACSA